MTYTKTYHKNQPFNGIILSQKELEVFKKFKKDHSHPLIADSILEESCSSGSMYRLTYDSCNIGHSWSIYCYGCSLYDNLSKNEDF